MSTQHVLLGLLEPSPTYGYELKQTWDQRFAHLKPLRYSQIYATLARLERDGLVQLLAEEAGHGPDRKRYEITAAGVQDLEAWLAAPEPAQASIHATLFLKVVLAVTSGRDATAYLEAQRSEHTELMRAFLHRREAVGDVDRAGLDYAVFHLEADLRWIDHVAADLSSRRHGDRS